MESNAYCNVVTILHWLCDLSQSIRGSGTYMNGVGGGGGGGGGIGVYLMARPVRAYIDLEEVGYTV